MPAALLAVLLLAASASQARSSAGSTVGVPVAHSSPTFASSGQMAADST